jgi:signal transduction histidine kinase
VNGAGITDLMHRVVTARTASAGATVPGIPMSEEVTLPGIPASVPAARRFVREALPGCPRADDLMLAVSELTSNAIVHSASGQGGSITVRVRTAPPGWARVEVTDDGPASGQLPEGNGWGLGIVRAVTDRAGSTMGAEGRLTAWAEVIWPG